MTEENIVSASQWEFSGISITTANLIGTRELLSPSPNLSLSPVK